MTELSQLDGIAALRVAEAMHPGVLTCPPRTALTAVARMMSTYRVHCVVVFSEGDDDVGERGLWGIVSDLDLASAVAAGELETREAGGTAATPIVTIGPDESLRRAAQLMAEYQTAHLVVTEPDRDRPVGILSTLDLARLVAH